jgi:DNA-binding response OmpR family regulator
MPSGSMPARSKARPPHLKPVVLSVDDEPLIHALLKPILRGEDFEVVTARSGAECLSLLAKMTPDLILMDVDMPRMNGYDTCRQVRDGFPALKAPVIFLTARRTEEDLRRALAAGGNDFLIKPFTAANVTARVRHWLDRGTG